MMLFEFLIIMIIIEVLLSLFTYSSFISGDIILERVVLFKDLNLDQLHTSSYPDSFVLNCLYPSNYAI